MIKKKTRRIMWTLLGIVILVGVSGVLFINQASFGRLPRGERLERIKRSPNYRDGQFQNQEETPALTSDKGFVANLVEFVFRSKDSLVPNVPLPVVKTDLWKLDRDRDLVVWFGHSSYLLQLDGKRFLVDPVFRSAAPLSFLNKPFKGTDVYLPGDMPEVDYLVISHDHWDHLDYRTVMELKDRVGKVICGLGVGEHFEYWGFEREKIVEMDWYEEFAAEDRFKVYCLPARHFSGRGLTRNRTLWASYVLETPNKKVYLSGDGGYGTHFKEIGERFPRLDLAIVENGQYNVDWRYIHLMPENLPLAIKDLNARRVLTVHHSKYALSKHPWNEPVETVTRLAVDEPTRFLLPAIGEVVEL